MSAPKQPKTTQSTPTPTGPASSDPPPVFVTKTEFDTMVTELERKERNDAWLDRLFTLIAIAISFALFTISKNSTETQKHQDKVEHDSYVAQTVLSLANTWDTHMDFETRDIVFRVTNTFNRLKSAPGLTEYHYLERLLINENELNNVTDDQLRHHTEIMNMVKPILKWDKIDNSPKTAVYRCRVAVIRFLNAQTIIAKIRLNAEDPTIIKIIENAHMAQMVKRGEEWEDFIYDYNKTMYKTQQLSAFTPILEILELRRQRPSLMPDTLVQENSLRAADQTIQQKLFK